MSFINVAAAAIPVAILFAVRRLLFMDKKVKGIILKSLCFLLLIFNLIRYTYDSLHGTRMRIPIEFSAVTYFVLPIIVLFKLNIFRSWAAYSGTLAGGCFFINAIVLGEIIYGSHNAFSVISTFACHGILLFCGLVLISEKRFSKYTGWVITLGLVYTAVRTFLLKEWFSGGSGIFICELIFAYIPTRLFGKNVIPFYYLLLFVLVIISFKLFFALNEKLTKEKP